MKAFKNASLRSEGSLNLFDQRARYIWKRGVLFQEDLVLRNHARHGFNRYRQRF